LYNAVTKVVSYGKKKQRKRVSQPRYTSCVCKFWLRSRCKGAERQNTVSTVRRVHNFSKF